MSKIIIKKINVVDESQKPTKIFIKQIKSQTKTNNVLPASKKAGIFIHWGIYSIPAYLPAGNPSNGSEWYLGRLMKPFLYKYDTQEYHSQKYGPFSSTKEMYARYYDFISEFETAAKDWNPKSWVDKIKKTGAEYLYITAKHHDGVSMYPSKFGMYHTNRDYIEELRVETIKAGLKFGVYYSLKEWTPIGNARAENKVKSYVEGTVHPQLHEIVQRYTPDILWVDGDWDHSTATWESEKFLDWLFQNTDIITNERWGKDFLQFIGSLSPAKRALYSSRCYQTKQKPPGTDRLMAPYGPFDNGPWFQGLWEHVNTISKSWGYASNQPDSAYKSVDAIKKLYTTINSTGGKFTINIGPKSDGSLDEKEEVVLDNLVF